MAIARFVTVGIKANLELARSWFVMIDKGERVVARPQVVGGTVPAWRRCYRNRDLMALRLECDGCGGVSRGSRDNERQNETAGTWDHAI